MSPQKKGYTLRTLALLSNSHVSFTISLEIIISTPYDPIDCLVSPKGMKMMVSKTLRTRMKLKIDETRRLERTASRVAYNKS